MDEKELFQRYLEKMGSFNDERFSLLARDLFRGQNSYLRMKLKGSSIFNPAWINKIEDCLYELGQIINNPREVTTMEGSVVPIELAKRVNGESVIHLASHSHLIKEVDENGNIIPAKILGHYTKEELHTYENKFIATFIRRLVLFVEKRYEFIKDTVSLTEKEIMYVKNKSIVDGREVEIETKISVVRETEDELAKTARDYMARIEELRDYVQYYYHSQFMKELKNEKDVRKPIIQTNILRKNPLYRKCYDTFLFIERFDSLGVSYKLDRHYKDFNENERKALNYLLVCDLLSLQMQEEKRPYKRTLKEYKPKLLNSIDDEVFLYGELLKGPIEFVRVDEGYTNYLKGIIPKNIPAHPNAAEKEYYKDEIELRKNINLTLKEIEALLARTHRLINKYEKIFNRLIEERNIEEARETEQKLKELRSYEQELLDQKREAIIRAAMEDRDGKKTKAKPVEKEPAPIIEEEGAPVEKEEEILEEVEPVIEEKKEEPIPEPHKIFTRQSTESGNGKFIVKTPECYYVDDKTTSKDASEAKVFDNFADARKVKSKFGGQVIKLSEDTFFTKEEPVEEIPVEEEPKVEPKKVFTKKESAEGQGKFIVKTPECYYVDDKTTSKNASEAKVFDNFAAARQIKSKFGGQVIKLSDDLANFDMSVKEEVKPEPKKVFTKQGGESGNGKFIVKTPECYYVDDKTTSKNPGDAKVFDNFAMARQVKSKFGGQVIKLSEDMVLNETKVESKPAPKKESKPRVSKEKKERKPRENVTPKERKPRAPRVKKEKPVEQPKPVMVFKKKDNAIQGSFIVITENGYYVAENKYSRNKEDAKVFDNFVLARQIKSRLGGKVIKL